MNILMTYNWIKEYLQTDLSPEDFARELSLKSMSVEQMIDLKQRYEGIMIGDVVGLKSHPDADKLKVAVVDIGQKQVEIVCGGKNLEQGMKVVVALPGSSVRWHGEEEWTELKPAKIRGVESFGMICAPEEIGFDKVTCPDHGIWDLTNLVDAPAGTPIARAFGIEDVLFDIEVTTNRPDAMSAMGLGLEGAASTGGTFKADIPSLPEAGSGMALDVRVDDTELCPRYMAVAMENVQVGPSPLWLQMRLLLAGQKPINNIVDITNYVRLEYGQPLHAFDYDKLEGESLIIRRAKDGEVFVALDDSEHKLTTDMLAITDAKGPVAVAGVMGGLESGTTQATTRIIFEAAAFDPVSVRKTSRAMNLYSDSSLLFGKGLSVEMPEMALARAVQLAQELAGATVASEVIDAREQVYEPLVYTFDPNKARGVIGVDISDEEMMGFLTAMQFTVEPEGEKYRVTVPHWRDGDIEAEIDLTEEIARLYGYHNMPAILPEGAPPSIQDDPALAWEAKLKRLMASLGYQELYGYSFVSAQLLEQYGLDAEQSVRLHNPLSSDLTHMRTSLMPSLLRDIAQNEGRVKSARFFDIARIYVSQHGDLPREQTQWVYAQYGFEDIEQAWREMRTVLAEVAHRTGLAIDIERSDVDAAWHSTRSAIVRVNGEMRGIIGQVAHDTADAFGIKSDVLACQLDLEAMIPEMSAAPTFTPIPEFPSVDRDLSLLVDEKVTFEALQSILLQQHEWIRHIALGEIYRGKGVEEGKKSLVVSLTLRSDEKTLTSEEVQEVVDAAVQALTAEVHAILR